MCAHKGELGRRGGEAQGWGCCGRICVEHVQVSLEAAGLNSFCLFGLAELVQCLSLWRTACGLQIVTVIEMHYTYSKLRHHARVA